MHPGYSSSDYLIKTEIGRGSSGIVYKAQSMRNQKTYVLKSISIKNLSHKRQQSTLNQVQILRQLNHPNIIKYYTSFIQNQQLSIIMQYAQRGDLQAQIKNFKRHGRKFTQSDIWRLANDLTAALDYLHSKQIVHRDIKCLNVLLSKDGTAKLGDLGASKVFKGGFQASRTGTPLYLAPEQVKQQPYDHKVDIWTLGCVLYTAACLTSPFKGQNLILLGVNIISTKPSQIPSNYSQALNSLIFHLLEKRPKVRPSIQKVKALLGHSQNSTQTSQNRKIQLSVPQITETIQITCQKPVKIPPQITVTTDSRPDFRTHKKIQPRPHTTGGCRRLSLAKHPPNPLFRPRALSIYRNPQNQTKFRIPRELKLQTVKVSDLFSR